MKWLITKNLQALPLDQIPHFPMNDDFRANLLNQINEGCRLVQFFGATDEQGLTLFVLLADDLKSILKIAAADLGNAPSYPSLTPEAACFQLFEREIFEEFGVKPDGHPWLKPLRKGIAGINPDESSYSFFQMKGEEVHEVGVGPIHAGVIEPGHFRFSCTGELVHHLEIELGFQHRGIERLFIKNSDNITYLLKLAESIAGDTVMGHGSAFLHAIEKLTGTRVPRRAELIRLIALELERVAVHLGDLSALAGDVAYLTGNSVFGVLRTEAINTTLAICGSRFGRGLLAPGGVHFDFPVELEHKIKSIINKLEEKIELASEVLFSSPSVLSRFEGTGVVSQNTAKEIGMVGPAARSSGLSIDVRADFPYGAYAFFPLHTVSSTTGDVFARAYMRYVEIMQSLRIIREQLENMNGKKIKQPLGEMKKEHLVVSLCEGWRGEIAHIAITDQNGKLSRYKIKDPSFHNWFALALAVRNEGISDFPLCNKSFNLSYCGFDL